MKNFLLIINILFALSNITAQVELPRLSPNATVSQTVGYTNITVTYCRPGVKERKVWGELVPYNKVWRTGANEATTIEFTTDVVVEGNKVPAGKYGLFTIPTDKEWTIILNKVWNQWGAFNYDSKQDFLRFKVLPLEHPFTERMMFAFSELTDSSTVLNLFWERLNIPIKIKVDVLSQAYEKIKDAIKKSNTDWHTYAQAAEYCADNKVFLKDALQWINTAIELNKNFFVYYVKAKVLFSMKNYNDALIAIDKCRQAGSNDKDYDSYVTRVDLLESQIKSKL
ncbi:DUF2911 domain-containing protein [Melioribacteraceae bacterium 4301-Me]|uniref:DUF2911 domain-containing protein n=1 Tax=Pyranulibacter aquaticus TaxID=3163344 RepID=UPI00359A98C9